MNKFIHKNCNKSIINSIENEVEKYRNDNKSILTILFIKNGNNIKDINDIEYDIYYEIKNELQYYEIIEHIEHNMCVKYKHRGIRNYINRKPNEYLGYIVKLKTKKPKKSKNSFCLII
jgi:hypothetical protein